MSAMDWNINLERKYDIVQLSQCHAPKEQTDSAEFAPRFCTFDCAISTLFDKDDDAQSPPMMKDSIIIHSGVLNALKDEQFNAHFAQKLTHLLQKIGAKPQKPPPVERVIISGHSLGGAYAQTFYFLLHGDNDLIPKSSQMIKSLIGLPLYNKCSPKTHNIESSVLSKQRDKDKLFVITTGAFLLLPSKKNYVTDGRGSNLIATDRIFNFINPEDPVPMVFGGNAQQSMANVDFESKFVNVVKELALDQLATATTVGRYYVIYTKGAPMKGQYGEYEIVRLIDGKMIGIAGRQYLSEHLANGHKYLRGSLWSGGLYQDMKSFGQQFGKHHNNYMRELFAYLKQGSGSKKARQSVDVVNTPMIVFSFLMGLGLTCVGCMCVGMIFGCLMSILLQFRQRK